MPLTWNTYLLPVNQHIKCSFYILQFWWDAHMTLLVWVLVCNNMCRYERYFGSFYRNPTILEMVSTAIKSVSTPTVMRILFIEIQWQKIIIAPMCLCHGKMWKSKVKNIFSYHFPLWPVGVKPYHHVVLKFPWLRNHLKLINNKNTATFPIRCFDQVFL